MLRMIWQQFQAQQLKGTDVTVCLKALEAKITSGDAVDPKDLTALATSCMVIGCWYAAPV